MGQNINLPPLKFNINEADYEQAKSMLCTMMRIRQFEETIADLVTDGKIITPCHLYTGQEAVATGVCYALNKEDYVFGNHRSHGHYIAKGGSVRAAMAEIFGKATGCSKGRGGSMHLCSPNHGVMGTSSIVSGSMAIAVGAALAESIRGSGRVTAVFHGDGVPEEGIWHEAANLAGLKRLPIIFVCENNLYCTHMSLEKRRAYDNLAEVASVHGFSSQIIDGNNVLDVFHATQDAVNKARSGEGPIFLECRTYRWRGHVGPNYDVDLGLRNQDELDAWIDRCPIKHFGNFLVNQGILSKEQLDTMMSNVVNEIEEAVNYAITSPYPDPVELVKYVFKEGKV